MRQRTQYHHFYLRHLFHGLSRMDINLLLRQHKGYSPTHVEPDQEVAVVTIWSSLLYGIF